MKSEDIKQVRCKCGLLMQKSMTHYQKVLQSRLNNKRFVVRSYAQDWKCRVCKNEVEIRW